MAMNYSLYFHIPFCTHRCAYCLAVFVALGVDGRPVPVPTWVAGTERDKALERYALRLVEHRKQMDAEAAEILGDGA